jgi:hypothetical protein
VLQKKIGKTVSVFSQNTAIYLGNCIGFYEDRPIFLTENRLGMWRQEIEG